MEFIKNLKNKSGSEEHQKALPFDISRGALRQGEPSLEEQVHHWKSSIFDDNKIKNIILPKDNVLTSLVSIDDHVYNDLEFFNTNDGSDTSVSYTFSKNTKTPYGKYIIEHIFKNPENNYKNIKDRQWIINHFMKNENLFKKIKTTLSSIETPEEIFWLWKETDEQSETLYDMVYFQLPFVSNFINSSESFLNATSLYKIFISPFFSLATPLLCFIVPYVLLRYMGLKVSFVQIFHLLRKRVFSVGFISNKTTSLAILSTVVWFAMYFYNLYTIISMSMLTNNITNIIHDKLRVAANVVKVTTELKSILIKVPIRIQKVLNLPIFNPYTELLLLKDNIFAPSSVFRNKGCILSTFWKIKNILNDLAERIRFIGYVDSFYTITEYLNNLKKYKLPWTFANLNSKKIKQLRFWHPNILNNNKKPVPNSLKLKQKTNTIIITGPNAAGKSTYVKTIFINSILAQTFGIALAKKWDMPNPFKYIDTYFNVPDVEGKTSTFQAEMKRCFKFVTTLETIKKTYGKCNALVALDEIFTSTNYKEGISGAYAIIKYISDNFPDVLSLVTTHYHCLAELQNLSDNKIMNYCLEVKRNTDGKIAGYSYKVKKGVSKEHVALDLLEKEGFSHDIITIARNTYNNIVIPDVRFFTNC